MFKSDSPMLPTAQPQLIEIQVEEHVSQHTALPSGKIAQAATTKCRLLTPDISICPFNLIPFSISESKVLGLPKVFRKAQTSFFLHLCFWSTGKVPTWLQLHLLFQCSSWGVTVGGPRNPWESPPDLGKLCCFLADDVHEDILGHGVVRDG